MSKIEVNTITQQCGPSLTVGGGACKSVTLDATTVTLGRCGATVSLAAGATQSGFGRTGTVDWCTTAKTSPFTAVSGKGYFVDTTCGAVTVTLPATPSAGDIISIKDYARTAATNSITFCRNGSKMDGICGSGSVSTNGDSTTLIYVDGTKGWTSILDNTTKQYGATFITATGGTITTCGDYKIHTFTSDGCFSVSAVGNPAGSTTVDYLVVAGGGGNGVGSGGGGGGAGGARMSSGTASGSYTASPLGACVAALPVTVTTYPITVGAGGTGAVYIAPAGAYTPSATGNGSNSVFSTITSTGGGGGGSENASSAIKDGSPGGSGGGGNYNGGNVGGTGNTPPTSPSQGNNGGTGAGGGGYGGGGGGGAACAGQNGTAPGPGGPGGNGISNSITGSATDYAGGGGGGSQGPGPSAVPAGTGGLGGGGNGSARGGSIGTAGTANTGGGAGGGWSSPTSPPTAPLNGGSGIVIIRYKYQ